MNTRIKDITIGLSLFIIMGAACALEMSTRDTDGPGPGAELHCELAGVPASQCQNYFDEINSRG